MSLPSLGRIFSGLAWAIFRRPLEIAIWRFLQPARGKHDTVPVPSHDFAVGLEAYRSDGIRDVGPRDCLSRRGRRDLANPVLDSAWVSPD